MATLQLRPFIPSASDPSDRVPHEPQDVGPSPKSSSESLYSADQSHNSDSPPLTPATDGTADEALSLEISTARQRRASTTLISQNGDTIQRLLGGGETGTQLIEKYCCGGGCCLRNAQRRQSSLTPGFHPVKVPDNPAFRALELKLTPFSLDTELNTLAPLPDVTVSFEPLPKTAPTHVSPVHVHPPSFVQPHPPYEVFSAPVHCARELTKPGAEKRTIHFDLDVTDYPDEGGVDFKVGGAIGIVPPNDTSVVDDVFTVLGVPTYVRDKPVLLRTTGGRWPTIWGDDKARELVTTRRELLTWCCDLQTTPPTKPLLRLLAEYATEPNERKILLYLCAAEGQASFCDLRTGPHITIPQLLHAFPSAKPPLHALLSVTTQLMPRFYSLSNDPHISSSRDTVSGRRLIEMAVSVHETPDWRGGMRTGVGSGFMERVAKAFISGSKSGANPAPEIRVPMFRGLMANPLSREFVSSGPMMLIGAGVGMAPFRGFILNRVKNANCANKIWLVQGVRDSELDELYQGELGDHEKDIKRVVQSRKGNRAPDEAKYVQDEVRMQADVVWFVANALDGRIFVCGSSRGMGEGVHEALVDVAVRKGGLNREQAEEFWRGKKKGGQYIAETW
ncbi:FAD binding domain protein [Trichodelitschia bisporula]|uniref:FAD binding domain protein n=1 Tax=Trichodelitschia bisporula TaxID=703511 RepID=A0A6G1IA97_9PEZI|nr:FAD binding domain protein [Trichodelitschia bisporula]